MIAIEQHRLVELSSRVAASALCGDQRVVGIAQGAVQASQVVAKRRYPD
nr:hypothetical protein [uncultured Novosphingobium sp.]